MFDLTSATRRSAVTLVAGVGALAVAATGVLMTDPAHADVDRAPAPTIEVGNNPVALAVASATQRAYVANVDSISVVDLATETVIDEFVTNSDDLSAITSVDDDAGYYVGAFDQKFVRVFDPVSNTVTDTIRVGFGATDIAVATSPRAELAYVTRMRPQKSRISVVNVRSGKVVDSLGMKQAPQTATTTPDDKQVWVGSSFEGVITKVNARTHTKVGRVQVPRSGPISSIAFSPQGHRAWVTGLGGLSVVNVRSEKVVRFMSAPRLFPRSQNLNVGDVVVTPRGNRAMVVNSTFPDNPSRGMVAVLGVKKYDVVRRIPVGTEPMAIVNDPAGKQTYVPNYADNTVSYFPTPGS